MKHRTIKIAGKFALVLAGYALAFLMACVALEVRTALTNDEAAAGMYAFADFLFFVGTLGVLSLAPTALGLYFLCPGERSWSWFSAGALLVAVIPFHSLPSQAAENAPVGRPNRALSSSRIVGNLGPSTAVITPAKRGCNSLSPGPQPHETLPLRAQQVSDASACSR
jgi:hypothetical protein